MRAAALQELPRELKELLRFDSPVQYSGGRLKVDLGMHGQPMKKSDLVIALIRAANRDPATFTDPERLDIMRNNGAHLSFGYGPRVCIGAPLTYLESDRALRALMWCLPRLALANAEQAWVGNAVNRGLERFPLRQVGTSEATTTMALPKESCSV